MSRFCAHKIIYLDNRRQYTTMVVAKRIIRVPTFLEGIATLLFGHQPSVRFPGIVEKKINNDLRIVLVIIYVI